MKSRIESRSRTVLLWSIVALASLWLVVWAFGFFWKSSSAGPEQLLPAVSERVAREYVDPVDPRAVVPGAFEGFLKELHPHAGYLDRGESGRYREMAAGTDCWTGIVLAAGSDSPRVGAVFPSSVAAAAGIMAGDEIGAQRGTSPLLRTPLAMEMSLSSEKPFAAVSLRFRRPGDSLWRTATLKTSPFQRTPLIRRENDGIVWLTLPWIGNETFTEMSRLAKETPAPLRLAIDLRSCRGGEWPAWKRVAGLFFPGARVNVERKESSEEWLLPSSSFPPWQAVVFAGPGSAPAAELLAQLFRSQGTPLLGEATTGRIALLEQLFLDDGSSIVVPVGYFVFRGKRLTSPLTPDPVPPESTALPIEERARRILLVPTNGPTHP